MGETVMEHLLVKAIMEFLMSVDTTERQVLALNGQLAERVKVVATHKFYQVAYARAVSRLDL